MARVYPVCYLPKSSCIKDKSNKVIVSKFTDKTRKYRNISFNLTHLLRTDN